MKFQKKERPKTLKISNDYPSLRICNSEVVSMSICNAKYYCTLAVILSVVEESHADCKSLYSRHLDCN